MQQQQQTAEQLERELASRDEKADDSLTRVRLLPFLVFILILISYDMI